MLDIKKILINHELRKLKPNAMKHKSLDQLDALIALTEQRVEAYEKAIKVIRSSDKPDLNSLYSNLRKLNTDPKKENNESH